MTLYSDIFDFLSFHPSELKSQDLNDYKLSMPRAIIQLVRVIRLVTTQYQNQVLLVFPSLHGDKSQRINDTPHNRWFTSLAKKSGQSLKVYRTYMTGIGQTCINLAAALFRAESALRMDLTNPSCTTTGFEWLTNNKAV